MSPCLDQISLGRYLTSASFADPRACAHVRDEFAELLAERGIHRAAELGAVG